MKMIMAGKRTNFDSESLEALMRLSHRNESFSAEKVSNIIEIWQSCQAALCSFIYSKYCQKFNIKTMK